MRGLDAQTGRELWRLPRSYSWQISVGSSWIVAVDGKRAVVYDLAGVEQWEAPLPSRTQAYEPYVSATGFVLKGESHVVGYMFGR